MSIDTLYGVNGVGKDAIAERIKSERVSNLTITSASRLCMYLLGITDNFDAQRKIGREQYKQLESMPQDEMVALEDGPYREFVGTLANCDDRVLMLSHLVFALHLDKEVSYLTERHIPGWYVGQNNSMIQLIASPEEILSRRKADALSGSRERPALISQIMEHQNLCDTEWMRIEEGDISPKKGMYIVENSSLTTTTNQVGDILYG